MGKGRVLRLLLVGTRAGDRRRAELLVERLAANRPLDGEAPEWRVLYEGCDTAEAMRLCEAELAGLDPRWLELLDFEAATWAHPTRVGAWQVS